MKILNGKLPERIIRQLARRPMLVIGGLSLSMKIGRDGVRYRQGEIDGSEMRRRTGASVGGVGLGAAGSYAGLVAGHFLMPVPILGGLVGGFAGGALGEMLGDRLGREAVDRVEKVLGVEPPKPKDGEAEAEGAEAEGAEASGSGKDAEAPEAPDGGPARRGPEAPPRRHI